MIPHHWPPLAHERNSIFKCKQHTCTLYDPWGPKKYDIRYCIYHSFQQQIINVATVTYHFTLWLDLVARKYPELGILGVEVVQGHLQTYKVQICLFVLFDNTIPFVKIYDTFVVIQKYNWYKWDTSVHNNNTLYFSFTVLWHKALRSNYFNAD